MTTLKELAQRAMDLFYQDFAPRDKFFDVADFRYHAATYYSATINALYQELRVKNRLETGFSNVELPSQWLIQETLPLQVDADQQRAYCEPGYGVFAFDFDAYANAINGIRATGKDCDNDSYEMIKIPNNQIWELEYLPKTSKVFYYLSPKYDKKKDRIYFTKNVKEVQVWYVPVVVGNNDNCVMSDNIAADVIKNVLTIMMGAKNGTIVQESNDGNKNLNPQTQQNPGLLKNAQ